MSAIPSTSNMLSELPYGIPRTNDDADLETTLHGVSEVDPASFKLRGKTYCTDYVSVCSVSVVSLSGLAGSLSLFY